MSDLGDVKGMAWPVPKFHFSVSIGDRLTDASFKEVSGLDTEGNITEYRGSNSRNFTKIKMPGLKVYSNVILRKGTFFGGKGFLDWFNRIKMNTIERMPVTIKLLDEEGGIVMAWDLVNAWPVKITGITLGSKEDSEHAIEELEIAHEGLVVRKPR